MSHQTCLSTLHLKRFLYTLSSIPASLSQCPQRRHVAFSVVLLCADHSASTMAGVCVGGGGGGGGQALGVLVSVP